MLVETIVQLTLERVNQFLLDLFGHLWVVMARLCLVVLRGLIENTLGGLAEVLQFLSENCGVELYEFGLGELQGIVLDFSAALLRRQLSRVGKVDVFLAADLLPGGLEEGGQPVQGQALLLSVRQKQSVACV